MAKVILGKKLGMTHVQNSYGRYRPFMDSVRLSGFGERHR